MLKTVFYLFILSLPSCGLFDDEPAKPEEPVQVVKTHYTLEKGRTVKNQLPFPSQTEVIVNWHYSDGKKESFHGYNFWDMNGDGRPDMLEVLDPETKIPTEYLMDLNFDGTFETNSVQASRVDASH